MNEIYAVIPKTILESVLEKLESLETLIKEKNLSDYGSEWIESIEVPSILKISRKTWQEYRNRRVIGFTQYGDKIYVRKSDIEKFMEDHYIPKID